MGGQGLLLFIGLKFLIIMTSLQNIVISVAQGLLMLMGSKFLIKMTRLQNIVLYSQCFAAWSSLSKILIPLTSGDLEHPKYVTMFCREVMMIKIFSPIKSKRPWPPISISHLFQQGFFNSWLLLFYTWGVFV